MNIFPINKLPSVATAEMCDQHIVKIISEAVLVYSAALHNIDKAKWGTSPIKWGAY